MLIVSERLEKLTAMLRRQPDDPFLLYGVALEHKKLGDHASALKFLDRVTAVDPGYCYAWHQKGLIHESNGDTEAAKKAYREGIEAANRVGDAHAKEEITAALSMVE